MLLSRPAWTLVVDFAYRPTHCVIYSTPYFIGYQPGFRRTQWFRERQTGLPPMASKSIEMTAEIVENNCINEQRQINNMYDKVTGNIGYSACTSLVLI